MEEKTLGLDLGTNSIGWAIVARDGEHCRLVDRGVNIFTEGVLIEKNIEHPRVEARTMARSLRRHYFRRRLRKIELLKVLCRYGLCPQLSDQQLTNWKQKRQYPVDADFLHWQRTDDNEGRNPYHDRYLALTQRLNLSDERQRFILGRALYHLCQRRGFLSNRKDSAEDVDGVVKKSIGELSEKMQQSGCTYLGEYFYRCYQAGKKIRCAYTARNEHYRAEFNAICERQQLPEPWRTELERAIFYQRPLKSQKSSVGKCTFEPGKSRCPISHPAYEEFRMLQTVNNIKIKSYIDSDYRQLNKTERKLILPLFFRKSKSSFEFEEIARKLAGKPENFGFRDEKPNAAFKFNMPMSTPISNCPVTASLIDIFGEDWVATIRSCYAKAGNKTDREVVNDVWHVLFSFDDDEKLRQWAITNLKLSEERADMFVAVKIRQGYASLSLNAIQKMLPYLRQGLRYDTAAFLANIQKVLPPEVLADANEFAEIRRQIINELSDYESNPLRKEFTKYDLVRDVLLSVPDIEPARFQKLYHPSMIEAYPAVIPDANGVRRLGSPRIAAIKNPMAMRALFRLRHLVNTLMQEGKIDHRTKIHIEFSRNLNDANRRKAIEQVQRERDKVRQNYAGRLREEYYVATGHEIEPTDTDILKYRLWQEQQHRCIYTNREIGISQFLGADPEFDIEHTVPRSRGGDDSIANKTLCEKQFNRAVKRAKLPAELANHDEVIATIESLGWFDKVNDLTKRVNRTKGGYFASKQAKDSNIQKRHRLQMELDYWRDKCERFTMKEVTPGFTNRQGVDIGIIGKYARMYLASLFNSPKRNLIYVVKGATTADFRKMWGLQEEFAAKERVNHCHHCIDAVVIACIGKREYDNWAHYLTRRELAEWDGAPRPAFPKPWPTFTQDVKAIVNDLTVVHSTPDNELKQSRKVLRVRGRKVRNADGSYIYQQGDTARASLHNDTFYGAIMRNDELRYVVRRPIDSIEPKDVKNIVDPTVRAIVQAAIDAKGFKNAIAEPIWMNEDKGIQIKKVRMFAAGITSPIHLKKHRDLSTKEYKQSIHVANSGNYCLAVYEGTTAKGKTKRTFNLVKHLDAAKALKSSEPLIPLSDSNDFPLKWLLKVGMMVLLYENSPQEIYEASHTELARRLYKITGLNRNPSGSGYGAIVMRYHQEARPAGEFKDKSGAWHIGEEIRPSIYMLHTQFNALIEGQDFTISESGEIHFKRRPMLP